TGGDVPASRDGRRGSPSAERLEIDTDRQDLGPHRAHRYRVERPQRVPATELALALARVVLGQHARRPLAPYVTDPTPYLHADPRIRLEVADVSGAPAVLGDDPAGVALEALAHRPGPGIA